jgi:hypothetical protein
MTDGFVKLPKGLVIDRHAALLPSLPLRLAKAHLGALSQSPINKF